MADQDQKPTDPYTGMHPESVYAVWHDPTVYDHMTMGPPYLPEKTTMKMAGLIKKADLSATNILNTLSLAYGPENQSGSELAVLLSALRAEAIIHQANHWQSEGSSFYGDHLLFDRLYNDCLPLIDQLAERTVGLYGGTYVSAAIQAGHISVLVEINQRDQNPQERQPLSSQTSAQLVIEILNEVHARSKASGTMSHGLENLLQGIADKHEEFLYLLKQRLDPSYEYQR